LGVEGDYTIRNLKQVEDAAPKFGMSPGIEARFARGDLELEQTGISYQRLAPNFRVPFGHKHADQEEIYVVLSGGGRLKLEDEIVDVGQWDAIRIAAGTMRGVEAGDDGLELLAFGGPTGGRPNDAEMQPGWWSD
jgi:mannose-6-phosphate isomerase-like protein (cupin superfamily)